MILKKSIFGENSYQNVDVTKIRHEKLRPKTVTKNSYAIVCIVKKSKKRRKSKRLAVCP